MTQQEKQEQGGNTTATCEAVYHPPFSGGQQDVRCHRAKGHVGIHEVDLPGDATIKWGWADDQTQAPEPKGESASPSWMVLAQSLFPNSGPMTHEERRAFDAASITLEPARDAEVRPFSCGTEGYDWLAGNCDRCAKQGTPDANGVGPCPMETAVSRGFIIGTIPADLAAQFGATVTGSDCRMPRQCAAFEPAGVCEWISWPGTRRRQPCTDRMVATVEANGYARGVCARHLQRFAAEHPERAPVPASDPSRFIPPAVSPLPVAPRATGSE